MVEAIPQRQGRLGPARIGFTRCHPAAGEPYVGPLTCPQPNFGLNTADPRPTVLENRRQLRQSVGVPIVWLEQYHSAQVAVIADDSEIGDGNAVRADAAIVSGNRAVAIQVADCVPILLADRSGRWCAGIHAGRAGLENEIIAATVEVLADLGVAASELVAAIGPHICGRCYEVDEATYRQCVQRHPDMAARTSWGTLSLDQTAAALTQLQRQGVEVAYQDGACTREDERLHSYRRLATSSGRNVGWIAP